MLQYSTKNLQRYDLPPAKAGDESPLTAVYAVASMTQLAQLLHDIQQASVKPPTSPAGLRTHLREFLLTLDAEPDRDRALHLLDAYYRNVPPDLPEEEAPKGRKKKVERAEEDRRAEQDAKDTAILASVRRAAQFAWEPYREAVAANRYYRRIEAMCAVRLLLIDLEGPEAKALKFSRPHGRVDDATLKRMGFGLIETIGEQILRAAQVSETEAKN